MDFYGISLCEKLEWAYGDVTYPFQMQVGALEVR
jgi:hypothetical protein